MNRTFCRYAHPFRGILLIALLPSAIFAQRMDHPLVARPSDALVAPRPLLSSPDTVRLLAVMVQFQQDSDPKTTGTGRFDISQPTDSIIDAPPHNKRYFEDHLTFLENYYRRVSRGQVTIVSTLLDSVVTLPATMGRYSPPKNGDNTVVAELASDAWRAVDSLKLVGDFSPYRCFVLFHAGSGRDVDLVASLGYDPTPLDIPSLYIGPTAFESLLGPAYAGGISVSGGAFRISNTLVMPETDNRMLPAVNGEALLELTINGLLCGAFGNFLGLPDLYNTKTGQSAIGRFGLMDGQAIFSFYGAFPPEPSAWERYWLGWVDPITIGVGTTTVDLPATGLALFSETRRDTVYRVPISASEYFLVENRNRDPLRDGQTVFSTFNGVARQRTYARDTLGFDFADISSLSGVITDVQDYDWSLPGGVDNQQNFYDGGVLIWHIDETVIADAIAGNTVNTDPQHRGVDVEEADGSQDIGQSYGQFSAGSGSEEGTALDFWFQGNSSPVYRNEFSATTYPNSDGYAGTRSLVTISSFSARGPRMTAQMTVGEGVIRPLQGFPRTLNLFAGWEGALAVEDVTGDARPDILLAGGGTAPPEAAGGVISPATTARSVYGFDGLGNPLGKGGLLASGGSTGAGIWNGIAATPGGSSPGRIFVSQFYNAPSGMGALASFLVQDRDGDSLADPAFNTRLPLMPLGAPMVSDSLIALGTTGGLLYFLHSDGTFADSIVVGTLQLDNTVSVAEFGGPNDYVLTSSIGTVMIVYRGPIVVPTPPDRTRAFPTKFRRTPAVGVFRTAAGDQTCVVLVSTDGMIYLLDGELNILPGFPFETGGAPASSPAIADIDGDGSRDVVVFTGDKILVVSSAGVILDGFPVSLPSVIASRPIVADLNGDGRPDIAGVTEKGLVFAFDGRGAMLPGFPLQAGPGSHSLAAYQVKLQDGTNGVGLAVVSSGDGSLSAWLVANTPTPLPPEAFPWPQYQHDARRSGSDMTALHGTPVANEYFPANRAYNWPNPVYDGKTHIRYYVGANSQVSIKIYDLAGDLVAQLAAPGIGGFDNEVLWDAAGVQSGVYFARIEASAGGQSGSVTIKIAVVK